MAGKRTIKKAKTIALLTGLVSAAACVYVAYETVSATGYDAYLAAVYVVEALLIAKKQQQQKTKSHNLQCG